MDKLSLQAKARELAHKASESSAGRAADTVFGGHEKRMRQTVVALREGAEMAEHESPGEATLLVIRGRVRLSAGDVSWEPRTGDLLVIPNSRHDLVALEDSAVLLTVAVAR